MPLNGIQTRSICLLVWPTGPSKRWNGRNGCVQESHLRLDAGGGQPSRQVSIEASPHSCLRMIKARTYTSVVIYEVSKALQRRLSTPAPINSDTVLVPTTHQELCVQFINSYSRKHATAPFAASYTCPASVRMPGVTGRQGAKAKHKPKLKSC